MIVVTWQDNEIFGWFLRVSSDSEESNLLLHSIYPLLCTLILARIILRKVEAIKATKILNPHLIEKAWRSWRYIHWSLILASSCFWWKWPAELIRYRQTLIIPFYQIFILNISTDYKTNSYFPWRSWRCIFLQNEITIFLGKVNCSSH